MACAANFSSRTREWQRHERGIFWRGSPWAFALLLLARSWDEGVFELINNALNAWPESCEGAYICCLSNPQNLDISAVLAHPEGSPFERILNSGVVTHFLMLANSNTPIHSRLWYAGISHDLAWNSADGCA